MTSTRTRWEVSSVPGPPDPGTVGDAIRKPLWSGSRDLSETTGFHLALLTVNTARVVVLADHRATLGSFQRQLDGWFNTIEPVRQHDLRARFGLRELADSACGPGKNQGKPRGRVAALLVRHGLLGEPLPASLRDQVLSRCRVGYQLPNGNRRHVERATSGIAAPDDHVNERTTLDTNCPRALRTDPRRPRRNPGEGARH